MTEEQQRAEPVARTNPGWNWQRVGFGSLAAAAIIGAIAMLAGAAGVYDAPGGNAMFALTCILLGSCAATAMAAFHMQTRIDSTTMSPELIARIKSDQSNED